MYLFFFIIVIPKFLSASSMTNCVVFLSFLSAFYCFVRLVLGVLGCLLVRSIVISLKVIILYSKCVGALGDLDYFQLWVVCCVIGERDIWF